MCAYTSNVCAYTLTVCAYTRSVCAYTCNMCAYKCMQNCTTMKWIKKNCTNCFTQKYKTIRFKHTSFDETYKFSQKIFGIMNYFLVFRFVVGNNRVQRGLLDTFHFNTIQQYLHVCVHTCMYVYMYLYAHVHLCMYLDTCA